MSDPLPSGPRLRAGCAHFRVDEIPAYAPCGTGEHLYVRIEKEDLTTDVVVAAVARACGVPRHAVGAAGRKDRRGITRQWLSVHGGDPARLTDLRLPAGGRVEVLEVARHRNKLRTGHLLGNRFALGIDGVADPAGLAARLTALAHAGIRNRFGGQRFGVHGAGLAAALAWGRGDAAAAVALAVDPTGAWQPGQAVPDGWRPGPEGRVVAALRQGDDPVRALRRAGEDWRKLLASAAQAAVFNAVLDARAAAGLLHTLRPGDIACTVRGAPFPVVAADLADLARRAAPGVLDARATGPLPGPSALRPEPAIAAEELAWAAPTGVDWAWFEDAGVFASPGERRPLLIPFLEPPQVAPGDPAQVAFALPAGAYATEVLAQVGIAVPADRSG